MRIPGTKAMNLAALWAQSRIQPHALILGYHRVADISRDVYGICISPGHFQEQMEVLQRCANPIQLQDLIRWLKNGGLPARSVVVTFDDGYAELLENVKPVLEGYQVPCTVFMVSGCLGQEFWWDELERLGRVRNLDTHTLKSLYRTLLPISNSKRQEAIEKLRVPAVSLSNESNRARTLSIDELVDFASGDLVEIGSHSVNHLSLSGLSKEEQNSELNESKAFLEGCLGKAITSFSYPNGSFTTETKKLVEQNGYNCACSSEPGIVIQDSDPFSFPRFWVPDWDGLNFKRWLLRWL